MATRRVLIIGPNDSPKLSFARQMGAGLDPSPQQKRQIGAIYAHSGLSLTENIPFRAPHHTVSSMALTGNLTHNKIRPGELSLAHGGILLLNDIHEFPFSNISLIASIVKRKQIQLHCSEITQTLPAQPKLIVATTTHCPCGKLGSKDVCVCADHDVGQWYRVINRICTALEIVQVRFCKGDA